MPQKGMKDIVQRMRWIPPGRFMMGSPESEPGRFTDEGPQHEATVDEGFWLFDTPCRQELWTAVTGDNPSHFKGPKRPVENVSWRDTLDFTTKLSNLVRGLPLQLPSETQWEYACRAGSEAATYAGGFDPDDSETQDELQRIAWYSANAGGTTHDVGELRPNVWGLFDMLGNVLEWSQDTWCDRYDRERQAYDESADRVIRGGGWDDSARYVRAASGDGYHPGYRVNRLGFRCSSSGSEVGHIDEKPERSRRRQRSEE